LISKLSAFLVVSSPAEKTIGKCLLWRWELSRQGCGSSLALTRGGHQAVCRAESDDRASLQYSEIAGVLGRPTFGTLRGEHVQTLPRAGWIVYWFRVADAKERDSYFSNLVVGQLRLVDDDLGAPREFRAQVSDLGDSPSSRRCCKYVVLDLDDRPLRGELDCFRAPQRGLT
jgi:hypothetical protein